MPIFFYVFDSDLKGSWVGRYTEHGLFDGSCMKDQDLKRHVILNDANRNSVINQLSKDTQFLADHNIMDYSLLLGITIFYILIVDQTIFMNVCEFLLI